MHLIVSWLILSAAVWVAAAILPGFKVKGFVGAIISAALIGILNWAVGWLFFIIIGLGTLGLGFLLAFLTRWVVDAIILKIADALTDKLEIRSFGWAFLGALVISAVGTLGEYLMGGIVH